MGPLKRGAWIAWPPGLRGVEFGKGSITAIAVPRCNDLEEQGLANVSYKE